MNTYARRHTDRAPITSRIGWAFWRAMDRLEREAANIAGFCAVSVFWALLVFCILSPQP